MCVGGKPKTQKPPDHTLPSIPPTTMVAESGKLSRPMAAGVLGNSWVLGGTAQQTRRRQGKKSMLIPMDDV